VGFFQFLALLLVHGRLSIGMIVIFPLAVSFGWYSWRAVVAVAGCSLSCDHGRHWRWGTASDTAAGRRIGMMLVRPLVTVPRGSCTVLNNRANFWRWTGGTSKGWDRPLAWSLGRS
jgi:hypothetical protein